jgi:hypothetical protein
MVNARAQNKTDCPISSDRNIGGRADDQLLVEGIKSECVSSTEENDVHFYASLRDSSRHRLTESSSPRVTLSHTPRRGPEEKNGSCGEMGIPVIFNMHEVDQNALKSENYFESRWLLRGASMKGIGNRRKSRQSERGCCSYYRSCDRQGEGQGEGGGQRGGEGQEEVKGKGQGQCVRERQSNGINTADDSKTRDGIVARNNNHICQSSSTIDSICVCASDCGLYCRAMLETEIFAQFEEIAKGLDAQQLHILRLSESFAARERQWQSEVRGRGRGRGRGRWKLVEGICLTLILSFCVHLPVHFSVSLSMTSIYLSMH